MTILEELRALEERDGILNPRAVVEFARNPETELHKKFEWDDMKAGEDHRVWQARQLIKVQITFLKNRDENVPVMAYVSLDEDRRADGGYRSIATVLSDDDLRDKLLKQAKRELHQFRERFQNLVELSSVFKAINKVLK